MGKPQHQHLQKTVVLQQTYMHSSPRYLVHQTLLNLKSGSTADNTCFSLGEGLTQSFYLLILTFIVAEGRVNGNVLVLVAAHKDYPFEKVYVRTVGELF